jgi:hypothetical protein
MYHILDMICVIGCKISIQGGAKEKKGETQGNAKSHLICHSCESRNPFYCLKANGFRVKPGMTGCEYEVFLMKVLALFGA